MFHEIKHPAIVVPPWLWKPLGDWCQCSEQKYIYIYRQKWHTTIQSCCIIWPYIRNDKWGVYGHVQNLRNTNRFIVESFIWGATTCGHARYKSNPYCVSWFCSRMLLVPFPYCLAQSLLPGLSKNASPDPVPDRPPTTGGDDAGALCTVGRNCWTLCELTFGSKLHWTILNILKCKENGTYGTGTVTLGLSTWGLYCWFQAGYTLVWSI